MNELPVRGEEFRDDLRRVPPAPGSLERSGSGSAAARRLLAPAELAGLTELNDWRSLGCVSVTTGTIVLALAFAVAVWPSPWVALSVAIIGVQQHALFILEHHLYPAVPHYRLPELHRLLQSKGVLAGAEVRDVAATMRIVFAPRACS